MVDETHGSAGDALLCSKYSPSLLYKPLLCFFSPPSTCLSFTRPLFPRVFSDAIFNSWKEGKMESLYWNRCPFSPECSYKPSVCECWSGQYNFRGWGIRRWSVCAMRELVFFFCGNKEDPISVSSVFPHTYPAGHTLCQKTTQISSVTSQP